MKSSPRRLVLTLSTPVIAALLILGCSGDGDDSGGADTSMSSPAAGSNSAAGSTAGSGTAFTEAELTDLTTTEVEGYVAQDPIIGAATSNVTVTYEPVEGGTGLTAIVTLAPCDPFICWDLDGEISDEHEDNLKSTLASIHIDNPDLLFEYGTLEVVVGYEAFYTYSRSFVSEGGTVATANAYRLIYHDSANLFSVVVSPQFGPLPESPEELEMQMDRSKGELTAKTFFAAYAEAFAPVQ